MTSHHEMPQSQCPACGKPADRATNVDGHEHAPQPGDITVCIGCGHVLVFDASFRLTWPTQAQRESWSMGTIIEVSRAQRAVLRARALTEPDQ